MHASESRPHAPNMAPKEINQCCLVQWSWFAACMVQQKSITQATSIGTKEQHFWQRQDLRYAWWQLIGHDVNGCYFHSRELLRETCCHGREDLAQEIFAGWAPRRMHEDQNVAPWLAAEDRLGEGAGNEGHHRAGDGFLAEVGLGLRLLR